jgi:hypothetical protein
MQGRPFFLAALISAIGAGPCWASAVLRGPITVTNVEALTVPPPAPIAAPAASKKAGATLQPAPLPDPDADGPRDSTGLGPGLTPAFYRQKAEFQGNGFSPASDINHGLNERRAPALGLGWTVPVK